MKLGEKNKFLVITIALIASNIASAHPTGDSQEISSGKAEKKEEISSSNPRADGASNIHNKVRKSRKAHSVGGVMKLEPWIRVTFSSLLSSAHSFPYSSSSQRSCNYSLLEQFNGLEPDFFRTKILPLLTPASMVNLVQVSKRDKVLVDAISVDKISDFSLPPLAPVIKTLSQLLAISDKDKRFIKNETLVSLDISLRKISPEDLKFIARHFPKLKTLNLLRSLAHQSETERRDSFSYLSKMKFLTHLNIGFNNLEMRELEAIVSHCSHLTSWNIKGNKTVK